ncbi:MAG: hypothetical protein HQ498_09860 [Pseudohongiella sp.]|jgi:hypothetical protein|nr:hypothetical protein [Pseudohongiella sp.]
MFARLIDTSNWTYEQWLAAIILTFIVLSVVVFIHRMVKLFRLSRKPAYKPNLRPLRRSRHRPGNSDHDLKTDDDSNEG